MLSAIFRCSRIAWIGQSELPVPERFLDPVFHDPAFKVNRLPGRWWKVDPSRVFDHPSYLGQIFPCPFPRSPGSLQSVQQVLKLLWSHPSKRETSLSRSRPSGGWSITSDGRSIFSLGLPPFGMSRASEHIPRTRTTSMHRSRASAAS